MILVTRSSDRYKDNREDLEGRYIFSFEEYRDDENGNFGVMHAFNEFFVEGGRSLGIHSHYAMEVVNYIVSGVVDYKDNMDNEVRLSEDYVQRVSVGSELLSLENNNLNDNPYQMIQIWFMPEKELIPSEEHVLFTLNDQRNKLLPVVSGRSNGDTLSIAQDVDVYLSVLDADKRLVHIQDPGRRIFLYVIDGELEFTEGNRLFSGDSARIEDLNQIEISTDNGAHFILIDLP